MYSFSNDPCCIAMVVYQTVGDPVGKLNHANTGHLFNSDPINSERNDGWLSFIMPLSTLYHGKSPLKHHLAEYVFTFSKHQTYQTVANPSLRSKNQLVHSWTFLHLFLESMESHEKKRR